MDAITGQKISAAAPSPDGNIQLPAQDLSLFYLINGASPIAVPGNGNAFNIQAYQSVTSKSANILLILENTISLALGFAGELTASKSCKSDLSVAILNSSGLARLTDEISSANAIEAIKSGFSPGNWPNLGNALLTCTLAAGTKPSTLIKFIGGVSASLAGFGVVSSGIQGGYLAEQVAATFINWDAPPVSVGICENSGLIENCSASLSIQNTIPTLTVGQSSELSVNAKDAFGSATSPLSGQVWSSSNTAVATVDNSGKVVGKGPGQATITVEDPVSSISAIAEISIVSGVANVSISSARCISPGTSINGGIAQFSVAGTASGDIEGVFSIAAWGNPDLSAQFIVDPVTYNCGGWTQTENVGSHAMTCTRRQGQPASISWNLTVAVVNFSPMYFYSYPQRVFVGPLPACPSPS